MPPVALARHLPEQTPLLSAKDGIAVKFSLAILIFPQI
jgi:hypothetical protein